MSVMRMASCRDKSTHPRNTRLYLFLPKNYIHGATERSYRAGARSRVGNSGLTTPCEEATAT